MARRKSAIDASLYAFSLFESLTGEQENIIDINEAVESCQTDDNSWMISSCFVKGSRKYKVTGLDGSSVKAIDLDLFETFRIEATQVFNTDEIKDLLNTESDVPDNSSMQESDFFTSLLPQKPQKTVSLPDHHYKTSEEEYHTKGERIEANLQAIRLLKELEATGKKATSEDHAILARYTGWGGLSDAFREDNSNYASVAKALTGSEYKHASESCLSAFYTPLPIIESIYTMLADAGFKGGRILEPSCGVGKFFGMMPKAMYDSSTLYGVEIDNISARIAQQLYPKAKIINKGFEKADLFNDYYDLVISNVPFGAYKVNDPVYNKLNLDIHDYFICKAVDKARKDGFIIILTESNTLDKKGSTARRYIADRAELIGALRLPDSIFGNSHTRVVTDLLILRKKFEGEASKTKFEETISINLPYTKDDQELVLESRINEYFSDHADTILGVETVVSGQFRDVVTVKGDLDMSQFDKKLKGFAVKYDEAKVDEDEESTTIMLPDELEDAPNFAYIPYQNQIWYRNNGMLELYTAPNKMAEKRLKGMLPVRDELLKLYELMKRSSSTDEEIKEQQRRLEQAYDYFVHKFGYFTSQANSLAFGEDAKYPLLCALEIFDDDTGEYIGKADIFTERTIRLDVQPKADNAYDALQISIAETGRIDFAYMSELTGTDKEALMTELIENYQLFKLPSGGYADAATYLSGYVKDKLKEAKAAAETDDSFKKNVEALEKVQPKDIPASEIFIPLGATWIPLDIYNDFMYETFKTPKFRQNNIKVCKYSDKFYISEKSSDRYRAEIDSIYGTPDISAYELLESCLNLVSVKITRKEETSDGKTRYVTDRDKTIAAQSKQEEIKVIFNQWLYKDFDRRNRIERLYNDTLNNIVEKEYDGSYMRFPGMNKNIELMTHQKNAVQRIIQNGNTMLAHRVGAGKTFTMITAAMELKRLGLCNKPMFVVPNHLLSQWAGEIVRLYPLANVLITTAKDFTKQKRKKFCSKIAAGNYDAILCTHSQFSIGMPLSKEMQIQVLQEQMDEVHVLLYDCSLVLEGMDDSDPNFCQMQYSERELKKKAKSIEEKIKKLMDTPHDETVTFEDLGVDQIFIDEAHLFKNLAVQTKLRNVAGLTNAVSKKAQDLYGKVMYLNEKTNYRGVVFATGTPISNAICELYVMQKYLEPQHLERAGIISFDSWISRFAETETKIEVKPEGTGYRSVIRCCKYHNLPELMKLFRLVSDIKVSDLNLDLPDVKTHHIAVKPSATQKEILKLLADRADDIRSGKVEPEEDNMLCVTNDGRKLAIDQRMYNTMLENDMKSKLNRCARTVSKIWHMTRESRATQLVFLDLGTPKSANSKKQTEKPIFDAYNAFKSTLLQLGVAENEIAYIHDANTDAKKIALYENVNAGKIRVLLGSTDKLGAGTNVQKRCIVLHHVDCPWRPSDLEQREGRIVRPGNLNKVVHLYSYVTVNTFDTYLYQTVLNKAEPIAQIMSGKIPMRDMDDIDSQCLNYAEIKALSTGNPAIKEKMELEEKVAKLKILRSAHQSKVFAIEKRVNSELPYLISSYKTRLEALKADAAYLEKQPYDGKNEHFHIILMDVNYYGAEDKKKAASMLQTLIDTHKNSKQKTIGNYRGFDLSISYSLLEEVPMMHIQSVSGSFQYRLIAGGDGFGNIRRLDNILASIKSKIKDTEEDIVEAENDLAVLQEEVKKPFAQEKEYNEAVLRLAQINKELAFSSLAA